MKNLVSGHSIEKSAAGRVLYSNLRFGIHEGQRIGLIGPNGAGKSTLLKIIHRSVAPDKGNISWAQGLRMACLDQVPSFTKGRSVLETLLEKVDDGDGVAIARAYELVSRLGFGEEGYDENTLVHELSGGWAKRAALGRELMTEPDLLLLDEPTNHLDVESIEWLEEYLSSLRCATLTVTHDRYVLNQVSNVIWELDPRNPEGLLVVEGGYLEYCQIRDDLIDAQNRRESTLKNTLRRETEWLRRGPKARSTKQKARIDRAYELVDVVDDVSARNKQRKVDIEFQSLEGGPKKLIEAKGVSKTYGSREVFEKTDLTLMLGNKIGLLGRNGAGKSTLLRVLLGRETPDTGTVTTADHLKLAYFEQNRESLDPNKTVLKTLCPEGDYVKLGSQFIHIRSYLDKFLFTEDFARKKVGQLSGGEQARLLIARLMLNEANVLVLDEPTNDLDLVTLSVLEESLREFPGALLIVSHDRYFLEQVSTGFICLDHGKTTLVSSLDQWRAVRAENEAERAQNKISAAAATPTPAAPLGETPPKKSLSYKDQRELDLMESTIHQAEAEVARLSESLSTAGQNKSSPLKHQEVYEELARAQSTVERLYARWAELEALQKP